MHAIVCLVNFISCVSSYVEKCVSVCSSRFAFWKTLFCIALYSLCSLKDEGKRFGGGPGPSIGSVRMQRAPHPSFLPAKNQQNETE